MASRHRIFGALVGALAVAAPLGLLTAAVQSDGTAAKLDDNGPGSDWAGYGRTFGEQHFSPLRQINDKTVGKLGLAWSLDLPPGNSLSTPLAVDGVLYFTTGYSIIHAVDAATGRKLWTYDAKVPEAAGFRLRQGWGSRGIAWGHGKIYAGTHDGRLIALDAKTGKPLWTVLTYGPDEPRFITGAPRVFRDMVIIGHGGADTGEIRGYVTAYDARTGKQRWRFYTVPGNPAVDHDETTKLAASSWAGEWWKNGGGGTVWNAMTYDPETGTMLLGTGNGAPWNYKARSEGKGDNLFLCSVVALDAKTGKYKWHYQFNPGETWDYNAAMDIALADLMIDGRPRKVLMTAPKNGFFYVIDRTTGKLISAKPYVRTTWASEIDLKTGRPVENPDSRFPNGKTFELWPGPGGAHNWYAMSYSPLTRLAYIPVTEKGALYSDVPGIADGSWRRDLEPMGLRAALSMDYFYKSDDPHSGTSELIAWDPVSQREVWRQPTPSYLPGSSLATAGNLVFQGTIDGRFRAFAADNGKQLWSFAAQAAVLAVPISYSAGGRQYVTVLTGMSMAGAFGGQLLQKYDVDYRTQKRRVLTFALNARQTLPARKREPLTVPDDPGFMRDPAAVARGEIVYGNRCFICHGANAAAAGAAPDLRTSAVPISLEALSAVVRGGALVPKGMPSWNEMTDAQLADLQQYLRSRAADLRSGKSG